MDWPGKQRSLKWETFILSPKVPASLELFKMPAVLKSNSCIYLQFKFVISIPQATLQVAGWWPPPPWGCQAAFATHPPCSDLFSGFLVPGFALHVGDWILPLAILRSWVYTGFDTGCCNLWIITSYKLVIKDLGQTPFASDDCLPRPFIAVKRISTFPLGGRLMLR